ncbi:hypothetical protein TNCV_4856801 [Trichonephila clavipes]|nr:hypothetical protein TNCV_4856801 [Trichonephila clavipes]
MLFWEKKTDRTRIDLLLPEFENKNSRINYEEIISEFEIRNLMLESSGCEVYRAANTKWKDRNKELCSSSVQGVPSTDVAVPDLSQPSAEETDSEDEESTSSRWAIT